MTEKLKKACGTSKCYVRSFFHYLNTITDNHCQTSVHVKIVKCALNGIKRNSKNAGLYGARNATADIQ